MGAWGMGHFDNDTACDWVYELEESNDLSVIKNSIDAVFEDEYIDADIGCEALAAIETLARLKGDYGNTHAKNDDIDAWVTKNPIQPPQALIDKSNLALKALLSESSELYELWSETDDLEAWKAEVESLMKRIAT